MDVYGLFEQLAATIDGWDFAAGLGLFLLGMLQTEQALKQLAGRRIKRFLRENTAHPLQSIGSGVITTALLQSSSLVGLLTLAMVGAQVIALSNGLGVVIGANLGTTLTGWVVATIGFKLNLSQLAMPLIAVGSIGLVVTDQQHARSALFRLLTALGLLLFGLEFMKSSVTVADLSLKLTGEPWMFLLLGIIVTAIVQSSSAAMMMTLAALDAQTISLIDGAAFVIGADLGTTSTVLLGTLKGSADKRRVGLAHFLFNLVTDTLAFFVLLPLLSLLVGRIGPNDPLYLLVAFHSAFNLIGIALFYPFINYFGRFLQRFFSGQQLGLAPSLHSSVIEDSGSALAALHNEIMQLARRVRDFNRHVLGLTSDRSASDNRHQYRQIKMMEGELLQFAIKLQKKELSEAESTWLQALTTGARELVHSAKSMKDCGNDLDAMQDSLAAPDHRLYEDLTALSGPLYVHATRLISDHETADFFAELIQLRQANHHNHETIHRLVFERMSSSQLSWPLVSSFLNVNRELFIANNDFVAGIARLLLQPQQLNDFDSLSLA